MKTQEWEIAAWNLNIDRVKLNQMAMLVSFNSFLNYTSLVYLMMVIGSIINIQFWFHFRNFTQVKDKYLFLIEKSIFLSNVRDWPLFYWIKQWDKEVKALKNSILVL